MESLAYLHLALAQEAPDEQNWQFNLRLSSSCWIPLIVAIALSGTTFQAMAVVQPGDRGLPVTTLQQRLQNLGYFQARITGYYGSLTKDAVIRFQQAKGLTPDGIVGAQTEAALRLRRAPSQPTPIVRRSSNVLQRGDRGDRVSLIQESLGVAGFYRGRANGVFGAETEAAVRRFQQARGLTSDGIVGRQTLAALPAVGGDNDNVSTNPSKDCPAVKTLQQRLKERGYYRGQIDGIFGLQTQKALEAAQRDYGVSPSDIANGRF